MSFWALERDGNYVGYPFCLSAQQFRMRPLSASVLGCICFLEGRSECELCEAMMNTLKFWSANVAYVNTWQAQIVLICFEWMETTGLTEVTDAGI